MRTIRNFLFLLLAITSLSSATVVTFTDRGAWETATTGRTNIDFDSLGLGVGGFGGYSTAGGLTIGGATFVGHSGPTTYWLYATNPVLGTDQDYASGTLIKLEWSAGAYLRINLPASTFAFGVDLMSAFPEAQSFHLQVNGDNLSTVVTQPRPGRKFVGFTSDTAIADLRIYFDSGTNGTVGLYDNFAYGALASGGGGGGPEAETPEAMTLLTVGSGLIALRWMRRRSILLGTSAA